MVCLGGLRQASQRKRNAREISYRGYRASRRIACRRRGSVRSGTGPAIQRRSRAKTENITTRKAIRLTRFRATARWIGLRYSGFRRYHSDCHVCHGPDGEGSTYAPALSNSLKTMSFPDFSNVVVEWAQEREHGAGERHAGVRHQSQCHVFISTTSSSIFEPVPMTPFLAEGRKSVKTSRGGR